MIKPYELQTEKFTVIFNGNEIPCRIDTPGYANSDGLLLLLIAGGADETLDDFMFQCPAIPFWAAGYPVLSFDLPCHASRILSGQGEGIEGFANLYKINADIFDNITAECSAVLDAVIQKGYTSAGKIAISGCSRGGYFAFRAMANDDRIAAISAICPVTSWCVLHEFERYKNDNSLIMTDISHFVSQIVGRYCHVVIGCDDKRVSSESCKRFFRLLSDENEKLGFGRNIVRLDVTDDIEHTVSACKREESGVFLLNSLTC